MSAATSRTQAFEALAQEVRSTFHQLKLAAEVLGADPDGLGAGHRGVLESLYAGGVQTVPALARARPVSRQHIQVLVNRLLELELVETLDNPAHQRSPLVRLTAHGKRRFEQLQARERRAIAELELPLSEGRLRAAAATLRAVREQLRVLAEGPR
jgi:DNA-binding MarR family transcriptional regulator